LTRRLRVVKYRGSSHGTNEYPFLIDQEGISVLPVTSLGLEHRASEEHVSTGVPELDAMLAGKGYYRDSTVLVSGTAGTGKTSVAAHFAEAACRRGERCLYCALEESPSQLLRNMRSIGIELEPWFAKGLLEFHSARPTAYGLEMHLVNVHKAVTRFKPQVMVVDPVSSLAEAGTELEAGTMLLRLIDFLKASQITSLLTDLTPGGGEPETTEVAISSLVDTWLVLRNIEVEGRRYRGVYVLKSRGMPHSNEIRQLELTDHGIRIHETRACIEEVRK
jgi:circadian clock protein KaiC